MKNDCNISPMGSGAMDLELLEYIELLETQPLDYWTEGEIRGYKTALASIKMKMLKLQGKPCSCAARKKPKAKSFKNILK